MRGFTYGHSCHHTELTTIKDIVARLNDGDAKNDADAVSDLEAYQAAIESE